MFTSTETKSYKIMDPNYDVAMILMESSTMSRYCAERAQKSGTSCWKTCQIHSDAAKFAADLILTLGTASLAGPAAATSGESSSDNGTKAAGSSSINQAALVNVHDLDLSGIVQFVLDTASRTAATCGKHSHDHCQSCAFAAGRAQAVLKSLVADQTAKKGMSAVAAEGAVPQSTRKLPHETEKMHEQAV
ncbi:hypothetical protein AMAG_04411 [Allomyces macrogynus ATCC 38327]|uniref:Uncharacterized protein n=1 Tax=Allomyces macrogynus (strain ATCC 38327) TaxID=578462 RepID=A0A0L0S8Y8_ALLM3|nr:hypothetical protein AMAG_04411 [Allomyces macrogynus ATCC 38327]|eukprot:KNE58874.1 hypothetical protein AMAG_04411 [Allomyces macrogynus ATCC 38327]